MKTLTIFPVHMKNESYMTKIVVYGFFATMMLSQAAMATTYYVRTDGGTSTQCSGLADAAYPGSGTNQACAFAHPAWALGTSGAAGIMVGGDTLIISAEQYVVGYGMPNNPDGSKDYTYDSTLNAPPAGLSSANKTKIYGKGYDAGCAGTKAQLWGTERVWQVLTVGSNTDVQCLEITDHSACIEDGPKDGSVGGFPVQCVRNTYPHGPWGSVGLNISDGSGNVSLTNVDIHGMALRGIFAYHVGNIDLTNVRVIANGFVGWDSDGDSSDDSYTGTITFTNSKIEWNGCGEKYPLTTSDLSSSSDKHHCWSQDQGGYGDGIGLGDGRPGNWTFINSSVSWNTSDGVDILHGNGTGTVKFLRSKAEGNAGQQFKTSVANSFIENSIIIGNCGFFHGQAFTSTKSSGGGNVAFNDCRANGDTISFDSVTGGQTLRISNSTILSNGNIIILSAGTGCNASTKIYAYNNIIYGGTKFDSGSDLSAFYYAAGAGGNGDGACGSLGITEDYNIVYNATNMSFCTGAHSKCGVDPLLAGTIKQGAVGNFYTTPDYAQQLKLMSTSPAINAANPSITLNGTGDDYLNHARGSTWDIGAYEFAAGGGITLQAPGNLHVVE